MKLLFWIILSSFLIFANKSFGQVNKGKELVYNTCDFTTDGSGKSFGIKLRIPIPCTWEKVSDTRNICFAYFHDPKLLLSFTLTINKAEGSFSKEQVEETLTPEAIHELAIEEGGKSGVGRKVYIDGYPFTEITFLHREEVPIGIFFLKSVAYVTTYKDIVIALNFSAGDSQNKNKAVSLFENYKMLFKVLATKIQILNQSE